MEGRRIVIDTTQVAGRTDIRRNLTRDRHVRGNAATHAATLITQTVSNNSLRHETLQCYMLANGSVTVAVEISLCFAKTT